MFPFYYEIWWYIAAFLTNAEIFTLLLPLDHATSTHARRILSRRITNNCRAALEHFQCLPLVRALSDDCVLSGSTLFRAITDARTWKFHDVDVFCRVRAAPRIHAVLRDMGCALNYAGEWYPGVLAMEEWITPDGAASYATGAARLQFFNERLAHSGIRPLPSDVRAVRREPTDPYRGVTDEESTSIQVIFRADCCADLVRGKFDLPILESYWNGRTVVVWNPSDVVSMRTTYNDRGDPHAHFPENIVKNCRINKYKARGVTITVNPPPRAPDAPPRPPEAWREYEDAPASKVRRIH